MLIYLSTLQWQINGSQSPYATGVGEIQNALPRWGTIHFTGYPVYTFSGSLFVTLLRLLGIAPAAASSLYSAFWGAVTVTLLARLGQAIGMRAPFAALGSLAAGLSLSMWVDASIAEVHTMTMALTVLCLLLALRFEESGARRDLCWLALVFTQGVAHQRAIALIAPAILLLVWPHVRKALRNLPRILGISLLAPLSYLYLPLREWMGADWTFGQTSTWRGFWAMITDIKAERIVRPAESATAWLARVRGMGGLLAADLPWLLLVLGCLGLLLSVRRLGWRRGSALLLVTLAYVALGLVIWEGRVSDALLATKLPTILLLGLGVACALDDVTWRFPLLQRCLLAILVIICLSLFFLHRPQVLQITLDPAAEDVIRTVAQVDEERPTTLWVLWGHDYWALRYAQSYRGHFPNLHVVDHNADILTVIQAGNRLLTLEKTFYQRPLAWWEERLGRVHLHHAAPEIVEISSTYPTTCGGTSSPASLALGNGITIRSARLHATADDILYLAVCWQAEREGLGDYAVAVHVLGHEPPRGPQDILAQADRQHPVGGWYPTSRWRAGECIVDMYPIPLSLAQQPVGVRVGMYQVDAQGHFTNTAWLFLPWPEGPKMSPM